MQQNNGNFLCKMIARKIHHFFFSFTLILLLGVAPAHSAGYTCDSSKVYTSCNANYYLKDGQCLSCPSGYPYSDAGATAITQCYSATKSRAMTSCTQNACSNPDTTGCASVTCASSCSCAGTTCSYVAYSNSAGTGDGTIKSGCSTNAQSCTKAVSSLSAKSNYYVNGTTSCPSCSSFSSTYTLSDGGNISSNYCYRSLSKTGSQLEPTLPTGCAAQSTTACTPGTCSYKDYYSATDTTCTPSNCTKTHSACTSANTNYYLASGVAKTCSSYSSSYPSSGGGNITYSSCYGSFSKSGSQLSCSTPSGCASATCGTCTPGTCTYTKYASGTIKSDCTPTNCTKPVASVTASANNYVSGTSCPTCTSYNSSYPYSDGGSISYTSCFKNVTKTGSQNACSQPANSVSYACNSCTPGTCTYRDYNGATDTTCTPTDCTQTVKSATCSANYYGTTSCAACSSFNSSYPYSDQGTTSSNYCYASKTNTGSQNACTKPDNCYSVTCNSCTPGTCSWRDYYNATDTTCTPTNCDQTVKSVTANANYYVDGTSCIACNTVGDKTYTASAAGNSGGSGVCYKSCTRACTQQATPTGAYSVTHGTTSTSGTHYYGGSCSAAASTCSLTVNSCKSTYYKNSNACLLCSSLSSAYANSNDGNSSGTDACYTSCGGGTYVATEKAACTGVGNGYYAAAHTVNYGSKSTNRTACTNAPENTNYTGSASSNSCPWACNAGYYGSSANGDSSCAACGSGYFCTGGTHRASCSTVVKDGAPTPDSITSVSSGSWSDITHAASSSDCICNWYFSDESTARYLMQSACQSGPVGNKYRYYYQCRPGYYASDPLNWGNWYTTCTACDNAPSNATYTSYSVPSEMYAVESNCPWECSDGYNQTSDNQCSQFCTSGITHIHLGNGLTVPLYSSARTSPAINVKWNDSICYGSLATGQSSGALNVKVGSTIYHATN